MFNLGVLLFLIEDFSGILINLGVLCFIFSLN